MTPSASKLLTLLRIHHRCAYTFLCHHLGESTPPDFRTVIALNELSSIGLAIRRTVRLSPHYTETHWYPND